MLILVARLLTHLINILDLITGFDRLDLKTYTSVKQKHMVCSPVPQPWLVSVDGLALSELRHSWFIPRRNVPAVFRDIKIDIPEWPTQLENGDIREWMFYGFWSLVEVCVRGPCQRSSAEREVFMAPGLKCGDRVPWTSWTPDIRSLVQYHKIALG